MGRNKPGTPGYSTPGSKRHRHPFNATLADDTIVTIAELSKLCGRSKSSIIDDAVLTHLLRNFESDVIDAVLAKRKAVQ